MEGMEQVKAEWKTMGREGETDEGEREIKERVRVQVKGRGN